MKIAFWNGTGMCGNVTGYLTAISVYCALNLKKTVYVSRNHLNGRRLEDYFFNNPSGGGKENFMDCYSYGEPEYFRKLWEENAQKQKEIRTREGICLIHPPDISDDCMFYREVSEEALYFMDIPYGMNIASAKALEEADIVVVFLPQDKSEIHIFFDKYSSIIPKALFLIADYRKNGLCSPEHLQRNYGIEKERTGTIPYNGTFEALCELGVAADFFRNDLYYNTKADEDLKGHFKKAARMLLKFWKKRNEGKEEHDLPDQKTRKESRNLPAGVVGTDGEHGSGSGGIFL